MCEFPSLLYGFVLCEVFWTCLHYPCCPTGIAEAISFNVSAIAPVSPMPMRGKGRAVVNNGGGSRTDIVMAAPDAG